MPWSEEETTSLQCSIENGEDYEVIYQQFPHKTHDSIRSKCLRIKDDKKPSYSSLAPITTDMVVPFKEAATKEKDDIASLWEYYESKNNKAIEKARNTQKFSANFSAESPIGISFLSDQHIAGGTPTDLQRMKADAEFIANTPGLYCCLLGDGIDNHIKHRSAIIGASSSPDEQYQLYNYYLGIFQNKVLVAISGNHDLWTTDMSGIDVVKLLADKNKIQYAQDEAHIAVTVGSVTYNIGFRHQYKMGSSYNQTHAVKQWLRMGNETFDIGAVGHHHEAALESFFYRGKETWVCRPGSYQITSYYASKFGFQLSVPTCPTFILFPRKREIMGFSNVYHAGNFLQYLYS